MCRGRRSSSTPGPSQLHDPFLFQGMREAVDAVERTLARGGRICVYGDYDVDGIMAVTILKRYLLGRGGDVIHHIPTRHGEGYGLNMAAMENLAGQGVSLLLTVDCGITALAEVERARELGMEVVVTDHHQCLPELPRCAAVIDRPVPFRDTPIAVSAAQVWPSRSSRLLGGWTPARSIWTVRRLRPWRI